MIVLAAFGLRVVFQLEKVFTPDGVLFRGPDSYYHMRLVDWMAANFPRFLTWDVYAFYPDGAQVGYYPFMHWLIAGPAKILGGQVDAVGAWLPPVLGALTVLVVYFMGKAIFKDVRVGLIGAFMAAIIPAEFLSRSLLGATDQHVLEVLLTSLFLWLFVRALDTGKGVIWAGLVYGAFYLTWHGSPLLTAVFMLWYVGITLFGIFRGEPMTRRFHLTVMAVVSIGAMASLWFASHSLTPDIMKIALVAPMILSGLFAMTVRIHVRPVAVWAIIATIAVLVTVNMVYPYAIDKVIFSLRAVAGAVNSIQEAQPTTLPIYVLSFGLVGIIGLAGIAVTRITRSNSLFLLWTLAFLLLTIGQRRWTYYSTIPLTLYSGVFLVWLMQFIRERKQTVALVLITLICVLPSYGGSLAVARLPMDIPRDWNIACLWLRDNTPVPFDGDYNPVYGVLSWWDYGHWIIRIGHRVPFSSNTQQLNYPASKYLVSQSVEDAEQIMKGLDARYLMIDRAMTAGKYYAIYTQANDGESQGWEQSLENSLVFQLYNTEDYAGYHKVFQSGDVKVFEKGGT